MNDLNKMDVFFRRKSVVAIKRQIAKIEEHEIVLKEANKRMAVLKTKLDNLNFEFFCGREILEEEESKNLYGPCYGLVIQLTNIRMQVVVNPNPIDHGETFTASVEEKKATIRHPEWYLKNYPQCRRHIKSFDEAKSIGLMMLKEVVDKGFD